MANFKIIDGKTKYVVVADTKEEALKTYDHFLPPEPRVFKKKGGK